MKAAKAGGGDARNRRRKACGRELLSGILETLVISADSALRSGNRARKQDCDSLAGIVRERLAEVEEVSLTLLEPRRKLAGASQLAAAEAGFEGASVAAACSTSCILTICPLLRPLLWPAAVQTLVARINIS